MDIRIGYDKPRMALTKPITATEIRETNKKNIAKFNEDAQLKLAVFYAEFYKKLEKLCNGL
jgi:hypothetical protein